MKQSQSAKKPCLNKPAKSRLKPSKLRPGVELLICNDGVNYVKAIFICRHPASGKIKAKNILRFPHLIEPNQSPESGDCIMSDYELSTRGKYACATANVRENLG